MSSLEISQANLANTAYRRPLRKAHWFESIAAGSVSLSRRAMNLDITLYMLQQAVVLNSVIFSAPTTFITSVRIVAFVLRASIHWEEKIVLSWQYYSPPLATQLYRTQPDSDQALELCLEAWRKAHL